MILVFATILALAPPDRLKYNPVGQVVNIRGTGMSTCATAFLAANRSATEEWIAGFWAAWDMAGIKNAAPVARDSDLAGIFGEVELACKAQPSSKLWQATLEARSIVSKRDER